MKIDLDQSSRTEEVVSARPADLSMRRASRHLTSREYRPAGTVVDIDGVKVGLIELVVMAGPCSVESAEQMLRIAHEVKVPVLPYCAAAPSSRERPLTISRAWARPGWSICVPLRLRRVSRLSPRSLTPGMLN